MCIFKYILIINISIVFSIIQFIVAKNQKYMNGLLCLVKMCKEEDCINMRLVSEVMLQVLYIYTHCTSTLYVGKQEEIKAIVLGSISLLRLQQQNTRELVK